jgi:hypothetical protein
MKRMVSGVVVGILIFGASSTWAADNDGLAGLSGQAAPSRFSLSVDRAVSAIVSTPAEPVNQIQAPTDGAKTLERSHPVRENQQRTTAAGSGGSHVGAIIGLVTAVGGIVGTVYMVKMMQKQMGQIAKQ